MTHDSASVRKSHMSGRNHLLKIRDYYQEIANERAQVLIDSITAQHSHSATNMHSISAAPTVAVAPVAGQVPVASGGSNATILSNMYSQKVLPPPPALRNLPAPAMGSFPAPMSIAFTQKSNYIEQPSMATTGLLSLTQNG